jgi:hypothetical protein
MSRHGWSTAALACAALVLAASPAHAAGGSYTHILCADPSTGQGAGQNGALPPGLTLSVTSLGVGQDAPGQARCAGPAAGGGFEGGSGIAIRSHGGFTSNTPGEGIGVLTYRPPANVAVQRAQLYLAADRGAPDQRVTFGIHGGEPPNHFYSPPVPLNCAWNTPCATFGDPSRPFGSANLIDWSDVPAAGFHVLLGCDIPDTSGYNCHPDQRTWLRLFGGRITLRDATRPGARASGSLTTDATLAATEGVAVSATDAGSGVYRLKVLIDRQPLVTKVMNANGGLCRDANPANGDEYEFATGAPCPSSAGGSAAPDFGRVPNGEHRLTVQVEDASGNVATPVDRTVTVDNPTRGVPNGANASDQARLTVRWSHTRRRTARVSWGRRAVVRGRLTDEAGRPIIGARLDALARTTVPGSALRPMRNGPVTGPRGTFRLALPKKTSSRALSIRYRSHVNDAVAVSTRRLVLEVRPRIALRVSPRVARQGTTLRFTGRLLPGPIPQAGKQIVLQARQGGGRWQRFNVVRTDRRGRFRARYRLRQPGSTVFSFRAVSRFEAAYPYVAGRSPSVRVRKLG